MKGRLFVAALLVLAPTVYAEPAERALELFNTANYQGAIALLKDDARDPRSLEILGRCYLAEADTRKATETLERAVAIRPNDSMLQTWLARAYGHRAENSFAMTAMHYANRTRETFERALQLDPANKEALADLFEFYLQAPSIVGGGVDKAEALLPQIARYDPTCFELSKALLAEHMKQYGEAEAHLRRAIGMEPGKPGLFVRLAKFLARRGRYDESDEQFREARKLAPNSPRIDFEHAETYIRTRRNQNEAREMLKRYLAARDLTPDDPSRTEAERLLRKAEGG
jgi:tetratricopeptide (TPR) repeat protein